MREWLKQCNDYSDLQAIEDDIYSNFDLLEIFSLIPIRFSLMLNKSGLLLNAIVRVLYETIKYELL